MELGSKSLTGRAFAEALYNSLDTQDPHDPTSTERCIPLSDGQFVFDIQHMQSARPAGSAVTSLIVIVGHHQSEMPDQTATPAILTFTADTSPVALQVIPLS